MILLDTVTLIRLGTNGKISKAAAEKIRGAEEANQLYVSAITPWELCLLEKRRITGQVLGGDGALFFQRMISVSDIQIITIDAQIAIESRRLPGSFHQDPGDRFIVATARAHGIPIMTADVAILDYAKLGHVQAINC